MPARSEEVFTCAHSDPSRRLSGINVAIAGGGIGGLALAAALNQVGIGSTVFEKQEAIVPEGSALLVAANAVRSLHQIGLGEAFSRASYPRESGELRVSSGRQLAIVPSSVLTEAFGHPNTNVERTKLRAVLLEGAGRDRVRLGTRVVGFEDDGHRVSVKLSDGSPEAFDGLVGADGIGSAVRMALLGPARARYVGYTAWQGASDLDIDWPKGIALEIWGRGRRAGYSYLGSGRWGWWASQLAPEGGADPEKGRADTIAAPFASWWGQAAALIRSTPDAAIVRNDIRIRPADPSWGRGRATLLGDAAHLMTPDLGQGAGQAIIDAAVRLAA